MFNKANDRYIFFIQRWLGFLAFCRLFMEYENILQWHIIWRVKSKNSRTQILWNTWNTS